MYNENIKKQFLEEINVDGITLQTYLRIFERTSVYEERNRKDLCEFSPDEYEQMVSEIGGKTISSNRSRISDFRRYIRWVVESGAASLNPNIQLLTIQGDELFSMVDSFQSSYIKDPIELKKLLDIVDNYHGIPQEYMGINKQRRVFMWLAYSGMFQDDAIIVRERDIDITHRIIHFGTSMYPIYHLAVRDFQDLMSMKEILIVKTSRLVSVPFQREGGDILLRTQSNPTIPAIGNNFRRALQGIANPDVQKLKYQKVQLSGIFYEAYLEELETGIRPDFHVHAKRITARRGRPQEQGNIDWAKKIKVEERKLILDYARWKEAFKY